MRGVMNFGLLLTGSLANVQEIQEPLVDIDHCHIACNALVGALGEKAFYGVLPEGFTEAFYSGQQQEIVPACVIQPSTPQDVSTALQIINQYSCHFAVKSGGHAMFAGASNALGGITIDLKYLNGIELSEDQSTASIGPGNRWKEVYRQLEALGLTVVGGRVDDVGVGGFMLGGGISFLSRFHGWAFDNVLNHEIVLANGSILNVNYDSHPDIFWALRGGGANFGIVTRFDLETFRQGPVWAGMNVHVFSDAAEKFARLAPSRHHQPRMLSKLYTTQTLGHLAARFACLIGRCTTTNEFIEAFVKMAKKGEQEDDLPYLMYYASFAYMNQVDFLMGPSVMVHSEPVINPSEFKDVLSVTPAVSGSRIQNLTQYMEGASKWNPKGFRNLWAAFTFRADQEFIAKVLDLSIEALDQTKHIDGIQGFVMQPITQIARANRNKNGGNPFNIKEEDGSLVLLLVVPQWHNAEDDEIMNSAWKNFMNKAQDLAKEMGLFHPWIYQNYADISQDVFAGFGEENRQKLREIQAIYDPEGIFARLRTGNFKL